MYCVSNQKGRESYFSYPLKMIPKINVRSTNIPAIQSAATALAANPGRRGFFLQNLGVNPLFVRFGAGGTTAVFNIILAGGTGNDNGTGGSTAQTDGIVYDGIITIDGIAPRYTVTEFNE